MKFGARYTFMHFTCSLVAEPMLSQRVQKSGIQSNTNVFDKKYFNQIEITRVPVTSGNAVMRHHHPLGSL